MISKGAGSVGSDARIESHDRHLRIHFAGGDADHADFHYVWLRHNCPCCRHPDTGERTMCSSEVPLTLKPLRSAMAADGTLVLEWPEASTLHRSVFSLVWLREHAYALGRPEVPPPRADLTRIEIRGAGSPQDRAAPALAGVERDGAVVVRGAGTDTEAWIRAIEAHDLRVVPTHFGRIEDLRTDNTTNQNTDQLGYTDSPVAFHTDQPFLENPPRYQMLHCVRPAEEDGDNAVADGIQAARYLRSLDAGAFELLSTVPVRFDRRQKEFQSLEVRPIVELRGDRIVQVRASYFTYAPHRIPFERMEGWYRAYARFIGIVSDPRHHYRFRLEGGDLLVYDNLRMLHARTGFQGSRWLRGVYFDTP